MMALLMMGSIIYYLTRSSLSVAAPTLLQELHISAREYSWIVAAFQGTIMLQPLCYTSPVYPGASSILVPPAPKLLETRRTLEPLGQRSWRAAGRGLRHLKADPRCGSTQ